jgi:hypothetical protein
MFLDLPTDIQENIYDLLNIKDRINLNASLPKKKQIKKTIKTNAQNDKKLGLVYYFFKKKKKINVNSNIYSFIQNNHNDPTCSEIISNLSLKNNIIYPITLQIHKELNANIVSYDTFDKIPDNIDECCIQNFRNIILYSNKVSSESFNKMIKHPSSLKLLKRLTAKYDLFFDLINQCCENTLIEILKNKEILEITEEQFSYIKTDTIAVIFSRKICCNLLIKYFNISYHIQQKWLEKSIEECNLEVTTWLMEEFNVLL